MNKQRPFARKRFGQNFLRDHSMIQKIVQHASLSQGEHVIEIGPGKGAMTSHMLKAGVSLTAIEIDRDLAGELNHQFAHNDDFNIITADVLKTDWNDFCRPGVINRVVANLPYNISTPILFRLIKHRKQFASATLMVQKELAERICHKGEKRNRKDYGVLSVIADSVFETELLFNVSSRCFVPEPKVDSSVIRLTPRDLLKGEEEAFFSFIRRVFNQRRKLLSTHLRKNEEDLYSKLPDADKEMIINMRPENLNPEQYFNLFYNGRIQDDLPQS
jgi:16S rRNA (adenine1518-N6/adenine1519-N6)-dimethyltransferase